MVDVVAISVVGSTAVFFTCGISYFLIKLHIGEEKVLSFLRRTESFYERKYAEVRPDIGQILISDMGHILISDMEQGIQNQSVKEEAKVFGFDSLRPFSPKPSQVPPVQLPPPPTPRQKEHEKFDKPIKLGHKARPKGLDISGELTKKRVEKKKKKNKKKSRTDSPSIAKGSPLRKSRQGVPLQVLEGKKDASVVSLMPRDQRERGYTNSSQNTVKTQKKKTGTR
eukprot:snap_masked-scaffold_14-processed-gene-1.12-mRNA-1 protein AED:1.00 eAED:1.00 QI:0/-1/0/0/-1/1/1/0/224